MQSSIRTPYDRVVMAVPVTIPYVRYSIESAQWWIGRALKSLVDGAGITPRDIDGFCVSSFTAGLDSGISLTQHFGLCVRWIDTIPLGGASAIAALRRAARAVQAGDARIVACVAGDTNHVDLFRYTLENFRASTRMRVYPYGAGGANASFALIARNYMRTFGARREDFGKIARRPAQQRAAQSPRPDESAADHRAVHVGAADRRSDPFVRLRDAVRGRGGLPGDERGRRRFAEAACRQNSRTIERHNAFRRRSRSGAGRMGDGCRRALRDGRRQADDLDFVQTYDDYPVISMMQFEDLGFCRQGRGPDFVRQHDLTIDGSFPHNTSGGQLSVGQAGAGGAYLGVVEAMRQVLGQAGPTQVRDARDRVGVGLRNDQL